jgi:hypothetical protein
LHVVIEFVLNASKPRLHYLAFQYFDIEVPDVGYYVPDVGYYVPDVGYYVPDVGYSRNASCELNLISTFFIVLAIIKFTSMSLNAYSKKIIIRNTASNKYFVLVGQFWNTRKTMAFGCRTSGYEYRTHPLIRTLNVLNTVFELLFFSSTRSNSCS